MDRRQRKTREAIFHAFTRLLGKREYNQITVGQIIEEADVGRATFYAHFETKDYLLKAFCQELFCHIFDVLRQDTHTHSHIFSCDGADSAFTHLFEHLQRNDNQILTLLSGQNNGLFWEYFKTDLARLVEDQLPLFADKKDQALPDSFWRNHIASVFVETMKWWIDNGMQESPRTITDYFMRVV